MDNEKWVKVIREDVPALQSRRNGKPPIYFDNGCTTPVPGPVIAAMNEYYTSFPGCGGARSRHWFAEEVTSRIEGDAEKGVKGSRDLKRNKESAAKSGTMWQFLSTNVLLCLNTIKKLWIFLKFRRNDYV